MVVPVVKKASPLLMTLKKAKQMLRQHICELLTPAEMLKLALVCRQLYEAIDENAAKVKAGQIEKDCIQRVQEVFDKTWATHTVLDDPSLSTY